MSTERREEVTPERVTKYLNSGGGRCPACESDDIKGNGIENDGGYAWEITTCNSCGFEWQDFYKLVSIADVYGNDYPSEEDLKLKS